MGLREGQEQGTGRPAGGRDYLGWKWSHLPPGNHVFLGDLPVSLKQLKIEGSKQNLRPLNCDLKLPEGKDNIYLPSRVLTNPRRLSGDITELLDGEWMDE